MSFSLAVSDPMGPATRSLLTAPDIETKKTGVTLAAYTGGRLYAAQHFTSSLSAMPLALDKGFTYSVYALVNMGDQHSRMPLLESGLDTLTYTIPSYSEGAGSVSRRGIPMAGKLEGLAVGASAAGTQVVPVRRLLARVDADFQCDWPGAVITSAKIWNMNARLKPFGVSAASAPSDLLAFQEIHGTEPGTGPSLSAVFYVPENMQGTIGGISEAREKSPDQNVAVSAVSGRLTYVEVSVHTGSGEVAGDMTYRSYLGANATTDFNLERGFRYVWSLSYHADRTQDADWKREGDMFRLVVTADRTTAYVGETVRLTATLIPTGGAPSDVTALSSWTKNSGGAGGISIDNTGVKGRVSATAAGTATFRVQYTLSGCTAYADSPEITFLEPSAPGWDDSWDDAGQIIL